MTKPRLVLVPKNRLAQELAGAYRTARLGQGLTFAELRALEPDDDARFIDWNATARTGRPYVRRYEEERALPVSVILDASASMGFGAKWDHVREAALLILAAAIGAGDQASMELISHRSLGSLKMAAGVPQVRKAQVLLNQVHPQNGPVQWTALTLPLVRNRRSMNLIFSDFLDWDPKFSAFWSGLARRSDVIAVRVIDPLEESLPNVGLVAVVDSETGQKRWIDTGSARIRQQHQQDAANRQALFQEWRSRFQIDGLDLSTQDNALLAFKHFFQKRAKTQR